MTLYECPHEPHHLFHLHDWDECNGFEDEPHGDRYDCDPECAVPGETYPTVDDLPEV